MPAWDSAPSLRRSRVAVLSVSTGICCSIRWTSARRTFSPASCAALRYEASLAMTLAMASSASGRPPITGRSTISGAGPVRWWTRSKRRAGSSSASSPSRLGSTAVVNEPSRSRRPGAPAQVSSWCWRRRNLAAVSAVCFFAAPVKKRRMPSTGPTSVMARGVLSVSSRSRARSSVVSVGRFVRSASRMTTPLSRVSSGTTCQATAPARVIPTARERRSCSPASAASRTARCQARTSTACWPHSLKSATRRRRSSRSVWFMAP